MKQQAEGVMLKERKTAKQMLADQRILLLIVIAAVVVLVGIMNPRFLMVENIVAIFQAVSVTGLLTMTMAMLLLNGGLDLSSGDLLAMVCVIMSVLLRGGTGTTTPTYEYSFEVDINEVNNFQGMELWLVILIGIGIRTVRQACQFTSVLPCIGPPVVSERVTDGIIGDGLRVIGGELIAPITVSVGIGDRIGGSA